MINKDQLKNYFDEYFFDIMDNVRNGITICDPNQEDSPLIYVNKAFTDTFEYEPEESIGRNCRFLQGDDREQKNRELIRNAIKEKTSITTVLRNYTKSGKLIYNEIKISPIFDKKTNELKFFLGIQKNLSNKTAFNNILQDKTNLQDQYTNLDLTIQELEIFQTELLAQNEELVEKDKRLEILNQEFSALFHDAPISYLVVNKNLEIQRYNKLADKYFEFSKKQTMIKSLFMVVKKGNIEKLISWINSEEYNKSALEISMVRADGEKRRFKLNCKQYMFNENQLLISLNDITKLNKLTKKLEKQVQKELDKRLEQEKFILKQAKLASMGEMIDAIAHQWLNPLSIIRLYAQDSEYLINNNLTENKNEILESQKKIDEQVEHLVNTLEEFRSFYRPDADSEYLFANELIDNTLILMKDDLITNNIECKVNLIHDFQIKTIKNQFKHVILNLLSNSKDAFRDNAIKQRKIEITITEDEEFYLIEFLDNAGGIPQDIINKIFEANFTTKGSNKGTGVGLYLCKQILDKFNILINVKNKNNGACFTIKYPKSLEKTLKP